MGSDSRALQAMASRHPWLAVLAALLLCAVLALVAGYLLAELGALIAVAALVALFGALWMLRNIEVAYWATIAVVCLLPFASFPFSIGFTPTLLDAALGALFVVWALSMATSGHREFITTPVGLPIAVFMLLAVGTFVYGLTNAALTAYDLRHFGELLLSIALFFLVVNTVRDEARLRRIVSALLICTTATAAVGIVLYVIADQISPNLTIQALSALGRLGYPTGSGVLRYIREDPEAAMRATSTSIDPNVLGSLLNISLAISVPQLFAPQPMIRRRYLWPMAGIMGLCLFLTLSRGSLVGLAVAVAALATLRYRRLWPLLLVAFVFVIALPQTRGLVDHFLQGFRKQDLATQMRLGEYKDALILIQRYPWLGVGFSGSPDIDTYIGVSMVYLLIAEQMGLVGLACFLIVMVVILVRFWRRRRQAAGQPTLEPLWWGLHAGIFGALVGGVFDHYFFNLDFHHSVTLFWLLVGLASAATNLISGGAEQKGEPDDASVPCVVPGAELR